MNRPFCPFVRHRIFHAFALVIVVAAGGCNSHSGEETTDTGTNRSLDPRPNIIVIFTDDQGYGDLGANNATPDIRTPQIDSLAQNGVRMTNGYVTAPQCSPSRAALMTGLYQQRFGLDDISLTPLPLEVPTAAQHLKNVGYRTGMVGKWHLEASAVSFDWLDTHIPDPDSLTAAEISELKKPYYAWSRGFDECFSGTEDAYWATFNPDTGETFPVRIMPHSEDRISLIHRAAVSFIERNSHTPFFLYVAPYAPHVPLAATDEYLNKFPDDMPVRRKYALAMMSAIDDGVGQIVSTLKARGVYENTLIFFISDNGAPLGLDMEDKPVADDSGLWNGSLNVPLTGEKGMVTDGGIRVPFVAHWPKQIRGGTVLNAPVSTLDAIYTALKAAGVPASTRSLLDGEDLMPAITNDDAYLNKRPLFWRFWGEAAVRLGNWKFLRTSTQDTYLFDMSRPELAVNNVIAQYPDIAQELSAMLENWDATLQIPGTYTPEEAGNYEYHLNPEMNPENR